MSLSIPNYYNQSIYNASGETIPPYAVVEIKAPGLISFKGKEWLIVGKPSAEGKMWLINSPFAVPATGDNRTGGAASAVERVGVYALHDPAITPETNDSLSTVAGQWWLGKESGGDAPPSGSEAPPEESAGGFFVVGDPKGSGPSSPGFPSSASTKRVRIWQPSGAAPSSDGYALIVANVPAATISVATGGVSVTPGYAVDAAYVLVWDLQGVQDVLIGETDENGQKPKLPALNPVWTSEIKAEETNSGAVIARGRTETRNVYTAGNPSKKQVFVIGDIFYPVTIVKAKTQQTVSGGDFQVEITETLWGRPPENKFVTFKNPDGWTGGNGVYALGMRRTDGLWQALDLKCEGQ